MSKKNNIVKTIGGILVVGALIFGGVFAFTSLTKDRGKAGYEVDEETAALKIEKMRNKIKVTNAKEVSSPLNFEEDNSLKDTLPDLNDEDLKVKGKGDIDIEIWSSPEKAGENTEYWLIDLANDFNSQNLTVNDKTVSVSIRNISSGLANDYITSQKAAPDLYTPSADIWGKMLQAEGMETETLADTTVRNVPGLFVKTKTYDELTKEYGNINLKTIVEATAEGKIATGYTNPYTSTTGLNFLATTLLTYDSENILSDEALDGFKAFQKKVPYVATTSNQMVKSAEKGSFDIFVGESQQYENATYKAQYKFVPFGTRHDNPVYIIGKHDEATRQGMELFKTFITTEEAEKLAKSKGFNTQDSYKSEFKELSGGDYINAQALWKSAKDNGKTVVAFFVADVSGSMYGSPILSLQESLLNTMKEINTDSYIGLITYADHVEIAKPLAKFDLNNRALFKGAVENIQVGGGTATNDALVVAIDEINKFKEANPEMDIVPQIILLSDGDQNTGYSLKDIRESLKGSKVPVHTIGYNYDTVSSSLTEISDINEASSLNANTDDVITKLRDLFRINL